MLKYYLAPGMALVFLLFAQGAWAFFDMPYISPEHPVAGETVSVNIRGGICDAIIDRPDHPQITQEGNAIRILFWSVRNDDPLFCNYPVGTGAFAVGIYPRGSYTLQVDRYDHLSGGEPAAVTLGVISFTVTGGAAMPASAPALSKIGLGVLTLGFVGVAFCASRLRRRDC